VIDEADVDEPRNVTHEWLALTEVKSAGSTWMEGVMNPDCKMPEFAKGGAAYIDRGCPS